MVKRQTRLAPGLSFVGAVQAGAITSLPLWTSTRMRSLMVKPACSSHCPARRSQKEAGLFNYTPLQKIGDVVQSDPAGVAKDVSKVAIGGVTAKTGGALCTTGLGCVAGGWMVAFGLSESAEGAVGCTTVITGSVRQRIIYCGGGSIRYCLPDGAMSHMTG
jgi:hypothetical protein